MTKLELYRNFTNYLAIFVVLSIAWIGYEDIKLDLKVGGSGEIQGTISYAWILLPCIITTNKFIHSFEVKELLYLILLSHFRCLCCSANLTQQSQSITLFCGIVRVSLMFIYSVFFLGSCDGAFIITFYLYTSLSLSFSYFFSWIEPFVFRFIIESSWIQLPYWIRSWVCHAFFHSAYHPQ